MMRRFQIIVEGDADKKFFKDYYHHIFREKAPKNSITHPGKDSDTGGYQKLRSENSIGAMRQNTDMGGVNLVIFDADEDTESRRAELLAIKDEFGVEFELFLLPNDKLRTFSSKGRCTVSYLPADFAASSQNFAYICLLHIIENYKHNI